MVEYAQKQEGLSNKHIKQSRPTILTRKWQININMLSTQSVLERQDGIYKNDDYAIGFINLEIATISSGQAMKNVITLFIST